MPYLLRGPLKIHYEVVPHLLPEDTVFLHGNLASAQWWRPSLDVWVARARSSPRRLEGKALLMDWRGFGGSTGLKCESDLDVSLIVEDINALLEAESVPKTHVVGHSAGGLVALQALVQNPSRFKRAVLVSPGSPLRTELFDSESAAVERLSTDPKFRVEALAGAIMNCDRKSEFIRKILKDSLNVDPFVWKGLPKALGRLDLSAKLATIENPVLILHGAKDHVIPVEWSEEYVSLLGDGRLDILSDCGHSANVENPELFVKKVTDFLFSSEH